MIRKTCCALLPFQAGLLAAFLSGSRALVCLPVILGAAVLVIGFNRALRAYAAVTAVSFCIGVGASCVYTAVVYENTIAFDGQKVSVKGYVYDMKEYESGSYLLTVKGRINDKVSAKISFYADREDYLRLTYGDSVTIKGDVYKITDSILYQSESYYKSKGVFLKGGKADSVTAGGVNFHPLFRFARELRDSAYDKLISFGEGGKYLAAVLCGEKGDIDSATAEEMYRAGIGHIFAFSGTHIVIIISIASVFIETLSGSRRANSVILLSVTWGLVLFSGLAVSAIRAAVMMSLLLVSKLFTRRSDPLTALSIAGFLITAVSPYCVGSYSFLLSIEGSFACSAYTDFLCERLNKDEEYPVTGLKRTMIALFCVGLLQMPVNSLLFGEVSLIAPLTNFLMIPVCGFCLSLSIIGLTAELISAALCRHILWAASTVMNGCVMITRALSHIPFASVNTYHPALKAGVIVISSLPVIILLLSSRKWLIIKLYALSCALMIALSVTARIITKDKLTIIAYSTGSEDSLFIYDNNGSLFASSNGRKSENTLQRLMIKRGAPRLKGAVCDSLPEISLLTDDKTVFADEFISSESLGSAELDGERIIYTYKEFSIVIDGKKVYNISNGQIISLEEGVFEIELDRKSGEFKVRGLDYGFDITY